MDEFVTIKEIKHKMIEQMRYNRGIYGLDEVLCIIGDPNQKISIKNLDQFLGKLGIFLTSEEQSILIKYLKQNDDVLAQKLIDIFTVPTPKILIRKLTEIFNSLTNGQEKISRLMIEQSYIIKNHPLIKAYHRPEEYVKNKFENSLRFLLNDKTEIDLNDFISIHSNMFYIMPVENVAYFIQIISELWGIKQTFENKKY